MEIRHLRYFEAVARELSFVKAAETLHVAQPALSRQIKDLEDELGTALFFRLTRGIELTPAGKAFLPKTKEILNRLETAIDEVRVVSSGKSGKVNLAIYGSLAHSVLFEIVTEFEAKFPDLEVEIFSGNSTEKQWALRNGLVDLACILEPFQKTGSDLEFINHGKIKEGLCIAVSEDHPLASKKEVALEDLCQHPLIVEDPNIRPQMSHVLAEIKAVNASSRIAREVKNLPIAIAAARNKKGVALVPDSLSFIRISGVKYLTIRSHRQYLNYSMVTERNRLSKHAEIFLGFMKETGRLES